MALEKTDKIWHNGKLIRWEDATIHVMSHVVHYGSSVFEGIRCYAPNGSPAIFRAAYIRRLEARPRWPRSARSLPSQGTLAG